MLNKKVGFVWKRIPGWLRLKIIRVTQDKFTVSAAAIITNDEGKVLLLNHALRPFSGWGLPGGFVNSGEGPEQAIRREIREETGIELADLQMLRVRTIRSHVEILFTATAASEPIVRSREILELGWFDVEAMPKGLSAAQALTIKEAVGDKMHRPDS
jgi:ADP-ribose pyrophosphatase YjhB (NUDIX family)